MAQQSIIAMGFRSLRKLVQGSKNSVFGIDIGLSAVKVAEMSRISNGNFKLSGYAQVALPEGSLIEDDIQKKDEIVEAIKAAIKQANIGSTSACIGLSGPNTVTRRLQLAGGTNEEIDDQVNWEAEQYIPFGIDESAMSYHIVGENEGGGIDVIIAGAKKDVVEKFKNLVEEAAVTVKVIDLGLIALTNVFSHVMSDKINEKGTSWMVLDVGAQKTEFVIYKNESIVFSKEINVGGVMITEEIQRQMGVNYVEAEDLKTTGDENGNLPEEILEIIDQVLEAFFAEIKKTFEFYITATSDESLKECYVTGGGLRAPGLVAGLEALLDVPVKVLNPFEVLEVDKKRFSEEELEEITYRGAVALGLAMREGQ